jgi:hypothetical protein
VYSTPVIPDLQIAKPGFARSQLVLYTYTTISVTREIALEFQHRDCGSMQQIGHLHMVQGFIDSAFSEQQAVLVDYNSSFSCVG